MDPLTHTLTGVMLARSGLDRLYRRSTLLLILAANVPDIDIVTASGGSLNYLRYHRWITHSVVFLPVMALLPVLLICAFRRSLGGFAKAWIVSSIAVATHLLMDWTNAYGIRLLSPFSDRYYALDLTNVVDVWIWAALLLALVAPPLARLVNAEIGASSGSGRGAAICALAFLVIYNGGRAFVHQRALEILDSRIYAGAAPLRVAAFPQAVNPLAWQGFVEGAAFVKLYDFNVAGKFNPDSGETLYKPEPSPAIEAARRTRTFQRFLDFCPYPLWSVLPEPQTAPAIRVEARDARFGFAATAVVSSTGQVERESFSFVRKPRD